MAIQRNVFMFSGQGSHYYQMGQPLFEQNRSFREHMRRMDGQVRDLSGHSVIDQLYSAGHAKTAIFKRTALTHPAIFMVQYALAQTLIEAGVTPELVMGTSLGVFAAAAVASALSEEDALGAVVSQAAALEAHCEEGGMLAILADPKLYQDGVLQRHSTMASRNFAGHFVVSGGNRGLDQVEALLAERRITRLRLPVSFAFHSHGIDAAEAPYRLATQALALQAAAIPMVCCARASLLAALPEDYFWTAIREPIEFQQTVAWLENQGAYRYIDVGPAGTLATFLKYSLRPGSASTAHSVLTLFGRELDNLANVVQTGRSPAARMASA